MILPKYKLAKYRNWNHTLAILKIEQTFSFNNFTLETHPKEAIIEIYYLFEVNTKKFIAVL